MALARRIRTARGKSVRETGLIVVEFVFDDKRSVGAASEFHCDPEVEEWCIQCDPEIEEWYKL